MDAVSYAHSAKQAKRIKRFIENPDSNSGVLTQPKVIEAGETVTIKSGRQAILTDMVVDGDLVIEADADVLMLASTVITSDHIVLKSATKNWKIKVDDLGNIITEEVANG